MWTFAQEQLREGGGLRFTLLDAGAPMPFSRVLDALRADAHFCATFNGVLAAAPYSAFRFETPPVTAATLGRAFEFVLYDSPELERPADASAFGAQLLKSPHNHVVDFLNLGGDCLLIVPCALGPPERYAHLAAFARDAPEAQQHALWQRVGEAMEARVRLKAGMPVWLSTAGAGVPWLHVRLDDRPKYYGHEPYRRTEHISATP